MGEMEGCVLPYLAVGWRWLLADCPSQPSCRFCLLPRGRLLSLVWGGNLGVLESVFRPHMRCGGSPLPRAPSCAACPPQCPSVTLMCIRSSHSGCPSPHPPAIPTNLRPNDGLLPACLDRGVPPGPGGPVNAAHLPCHGPRARLDGSLLLLCRPFLACRLWLPCHLCLLCRHLVRTTVVRCHCCILHRSVHPCRPKMSTVAPSMQVPTMALRTTIVHRETTAVQVPSALVVVAMGSGLSWMPLVSVTTSRVLSVQPSCHRLFLSWGATQPTVLAVCLCQTP